MAEQVRMEFDGDFGFLDEVDEIEKIVTVADPCAYWQKAADLIRAWAKYQSIKKLYINATHDETRHKVWPVVMKYHGGSVQRVHNYEQELALKVKRILAEFDVVCAEYGVEPVSLEWLYQKMKDKNDYASYRRKCERRMKKVKPATSLREL